MVFNIVIDPKTYAFHTVYTPPDIFSVKISNSMKKKNINTVKVILMLSLTPKYMHFIYTVPFKRVFLSKKVYFYSERMH